MSDTITIAHDNLVIFLREFVAAIKDGYSMEDSNRGWPYASLMKEVQLFKEPVAHVQHLNKYEDDTVVIAEYDLSRFMAELQYATKAGYAMIEDTLYFDALKSVMVKKAEVECSTIVTPTEEEINEPSVEVKKPRGRKAKS